ncbi:MAG: polysaccharide deacetylase family protein [Planctomycetales bacterium]|nr:polysaccharide deacetylase family protein [Planctomycetales bacterium]
MTLWKRPLLSAYYAASLPARQSAAAARKSCGREPVRILFFHRIADACPNPWTMPCRTFERQVSWIARHYEVVSLHEAQQRIRSGTNHKPTACLTFDDGYAENCEFALPLLLKRSLPFTYFVTTDNVLRGKPFAHDLADGVALKPNTLAELRALAKSGVEIGAHTRSHADLGRLESESELQEEIVGSKQELEDAIGRHVRYFAFPFGLHANMSPAAYRVACQGGYEGVCSAYGSYNWPGEDPFHLRRFHADVGMVRLKNWMTIDPRKFQVEEFDPGDFRANLCAAESREEVSH